MDDVDRRYLPTVSKLLSSTPPKKLYHYTNSQGILGIMKSKTIWATEVRFLNDSKEMEQAKEYVQLHASNLRTNQQSAQFSSDEKELLQLLEDGAKELRLFVCVVSFSEEGDQLSQWRACTKGEDGCSLGVSSGLLSKCAKNSGFLFGPCIYDHKDSYIMAGEIVMNLVRTYRESERSPEEKERLKLQVGIDITRYGAFLKHSTFSEEKE